MSDILQLHPDQDCAEVLAAQVEALFRASEHDHGRGRHLTVGGNGTRSAFGLPADATLALGRHCGLVAYQPEELTLRARAGTPLATLEAILAEHNQSFAAEVPQPAPHSTLGGAIACGWDGPARAFGMSLRDAVLGCRFINGRGEIVNFGGQVMKNVAGYDLARLQVGALGTLGALLDITLRLQPRAERIATVSFAVNAEQLASWWQRTRALRPLLTATCYLDGRLYLRLSGREAAVDALCQDLGGEGGELNWAALANMQLPFFCAERLACVHLPRFARLPLAAGESLVEWEGARVWVRDGDHHALARDAAAQGGFVQVLRGPAITPQMDAPDWHRALRTALDPLGLFNPGVYRTQFCADNRSREEVR